MTSLIKNTDMILIDIECTCEKDIQLSEPEVIEIGAAVVKGNTFEIIDIFSAFIKPIKRPQLTDFCKTLTMITQENIDSSLTFNEVWPDFLSWVDSKNINIFATWGMPDIPLLKAECFRHNQPMFRGQYIDIKKAFFKSNRLKFRCGLSKALSIAQVKPEGQSHRALDDVRNTAKLLEFIVSNKIVPLNQQRMDEYCTTELIMNFRKSVLDKCTTNII